MKTPKTTLLDYLDWRGDLSFVTDALNEVDCLVFSTLAYIDFSTTAFVNAFDYNLAPTIKQVYQSIKHKRRDDKKFMQLLEKCASSERFKDVIVFAYESNINEELRTQFAGVSFYTGLETVITFRGTDDTLVGWQEDLNMSFSIIPAQSYAQNYANNVAVAIGDIPYYICGHSKGGNLAIWSASNLSDENFTRLLKVYNFDGPGFCGDFTSCAGYNRILERTTSYVVDASVVGMFLSNKTEEKIVASCELGTIMQHYPMSWVVVGKSFYTLEKRSAVAKATDVIIDDWISTMTLDERKQITQILFEIMSSSNAKTLTQLRGPEGAQKMLAMLKAYSSTDKEKKQFLMEVIGRLKGILKKRAISLFDNILE